MSRLVRITHRPSGTVVAEGPLGWAITPFEGNYYISRRFLNATFKPNFIPGFCIYKFLYVGMDLLLPNHGREIGLGWLYFLPNPLLPFIWYRVAVPQRHRSLIVEDLASA
jgi:hypothetical protein